MTRRENSLALFHLLGKVLYNKRESFDRATYLVSIELSIPTLFPQAKATHPATLLPREINTARRNSTRGCILLRLYPCGRVDMNGNLVGST